MGTSTAATGATVSREGAGPGEQAAGAVMREDQATSSDLQEGSLATQRSGDIERLQTAGSMVLNLQGQAPHAKPKSAQAGLLRGILLSILPFIL